MNFWTGLLFGYLILNCFVAAFVMICPRKSWWFLASWQYQDPEANEPSYIAYFWRRIGGAVLLLLSLGLLPLVPKDTGTKPPRPKIQLQPYVPPNLAPSKKSG